MMDRMNGPGVGSAMTRLGALLLSVAIAACGGSAKGGSTTPGTASGGTPAGDTSQSMNDPGAPADPGAGGIEGGTPAASTDPGAAPAAPGDGGDAAPEPPILPPNLDPDPAQARAQVDQHLSVARAALARPTPDADAALAQARQALAIDAASVDAAAMVAFAYYHKRLYDTAELVLDDLFKRETAKKNANVYYVYGLIYDRTNRPERALLAYQKAVGIDPNHASALTNLGVHQLKNTQYGAAQRTFERLTSELQRTDAVTLTSLGSAYRGRSADYPAGTSERDQFVRSAEAQYKRALQASSSYGPAYYNLGLLYLDNDPFPGVADPLVRLNAAKSYFDQYKNMPGVDIALYDARMKDVTKAIKRAEKLLKKKKKPTP